MGSYSATKENCSVKTEMASHALGYLVGSAAHRKGDVRNSVFGTKPALENRYTATTLFEQRRWETACMMLLSDELVEL